MMELRREPWTEAQGGSRECVPSTSEVKGTAKSEALNRNEVSGWSRAIN